ncbi:MAG: hypothetical protein AAF226_00720 [Verrucomicrobiota bacterium]
MVALVVGVAIQPAFSAEVAKQPAAKSGSPKPKAAAKPAPEKAEAKPAKPEKKTVEVKSEELKVTVDLAGVIEAKNSSEIIVNTKSWAALTVVEAAAHGTKVKKGDIILRLEAEKLERQISDKKKDQPLAELNLEAAKSALALLEKTTPLSVNAARKSKSEAEADLAYFEDVTRPMTERDAKEMKKFYEARLAYALEELNQLKKMYEQDDLTEETEEIILQRAQNDVNSAKWNLEQMEERVKRRLSTTIPRDHDLRRRDLELKQIQWRDGEKKFRRDIEAKKLELAKQERDLERSKETLADLEHDLKLMTVKAPHDGVIYYGTALKGKWITASAVERKLIPNGKIAPREVVMTLVDPSAVQLRVAAGEDKLKDLAVGQSGESEMKWNKDLKLLSEVASISYVPMASNAFDVVLDLDLEGVDKPVMPGMNATAKVKTYHQEKALVIPANAVKEEDEKSFVTVKGGKKREVTTGRKSGSKIEILKGLKAGEHIELPEAEPKKPATPEKKPEEKK